MDIYVCKYCNKQWNTNQARNGHQTHCPLNPKKMKTEFKAKLALIGRKPTRFSIKKVFVLQCVKCKQTFSLQLSERQYISGRYKKCCSRKCANSRIWTDQDKVKKSISAKGSQHVHIANSKRIAPSYTKICPVCQIQFETKQNTQRFCGRKCVCQARKLGLQIITKPLGGYRKQSIKNYKAGWYKGIWCDSSWQLAYLVYHLDNNINIERCSIKLPYTFNGEQHLYNPDFLVEQKMIEIKGYQNDKAKAKKEQYPEVIILYQKDILPYVKYAKFKYGYDFTNLYE